MKGPVKAYFQVPDTPELAEIVKGTVGPDRRRIDPDDQFMGPAWPRARSHRALARDRPGRLLHAGPVRRRSRDAGRMPEARSEGAAGGARRDLEHGPPRLLTRAVLLHADRICPAFPTSVRRGQHLRQRLRRFPGGAPGQGDWQEGGYWLDLIRQYCFSHNVGLRRCSGPLGQPDRGAADGRELPRQDLQHPGSDGARIPRPDRRVRQRPACRHQRCQTPRAWFPRGARSSTDASATAISRRGGARSGLPRSAAGWPSCSKNASSRFPIQVLDDQPTPARANPSQPSKATPRRLIDIYHRQPRLSPIEMLLPDDLDQHPLGSAPVELAVEDLLPRAEIQLPFGDRHHDLAAHDLALVVGVGVILAGAVMVIPLG